MNLGLHGRKAVVVGGTRGIGRAIVEILAEKGCDVGLCARGASGVDATVVELGRRGAKAFGAPADAGDPVALRARTQNVQR